MALLRSAFRHPMHIGAPGRPTPTPGVPTATERRSSCPRARTIEVEMSPRPPTDLPEGESGAVSGAPGAERMALGLALQARADEIGGQVSARFPDFLRSEAFASSRL